MVNDLINSERKYVKLLRFIIEVSMKLSLRPCFQLWNCTWDELEFYVILYFFQNHLVEMDSDDLPDSLMGKKDELFSNIKDIYSFHTRFDDLRYFFYLVIFWFGYL